jgi:hypothetical protein
MGNLISTIGVYVGYFALGIFLGVIGCFVTYIFARVISLAIFKSFEQLFIGGSNEEKGQEG